MKRVPRPTDGSACSEAAIRQEHLYAKALGAEVTFLHALEDFTVAVYTTPGVMTRQPDLYQALKRAARRGRC